ncbi:alpha/beta fold hydrolase [Rhodococcus sp. 14-2470-1b]|uniref:alpha/beta fold hydrolase n=1 Tax=Rhodococcus sp. 14-2470-1b TaxID=2023149 RepID=UPI0026E453D2|nr:alpha/beta hydrolase [Rhodococcus sp. 14-2470-1b]
MHGRSAGSGPAVVLLHGHPRTHTTWYRVAPLVVDAGFTVICPDLRGYGHSSKPTPSADHENYSDRAMANDIAGLMNDLGHEQFAIAGHDRGSYVAYRAALDYPDRVSALAVLDSVPIVEALERVDAHFAETWWHWFFYATPAAQRLIVADSIGWYQPDPHTMGQQNYDDLVDALGDPDTVRSMLEDYAAGLHVDRLADEHDRSTGRAVSSGGCADQLCDFF